MRSNAQKKPYFPFIDIVAMLNAWESDRAVCFVTVELMHNIVPKLKVHNVY